MKVKRNLVIGLISSIACFLIGCLVGSYFEYTSRTAENYRRILKEYQYVRDNFHLTDEEMAEFGEKIPQFCAIWRHRIGWPRFMH